MTEPTGIFSQVPALLASQLAYWRARLQLAGLESKEAAVHYAVILGLAIGGLVIAVFGYLFLVIALVFLIASLCDSEHAWIWITLGAAFLHFLGTAVLLFVAKGKLSRPMFAATLDEFRKDQQWLKTPANPS
jgi:uncharacterized membrane protein YqjE